MATGQAGNLKKGRAESADMVKMISVADLKPYPNNPRNNRAAINDLANSIRDFGFKQPVVVDVNNVIVAGHSRLEAAKMLGLKEVPCIVASDLTPEQVRAYRLADNKIAEKAEWDDDLLNLELADLDLPDIDMSLYGFDEAELEKLIEPYQPASAPVSQIPRAEVESESKLSVSHGVSSGNVGVNAKDSSADTSKDEDEETSRDDELNQNSGYYGDERERTYNLYRLYEYDPGRVAGFYDMPVIKASHFVPDALIGFNYVKSIVENNKTSEYSKGVHFYLDDYQFERIWKDPYTHIERIKNFACALTPDFSTYADMPVAMKIWNTYRSKLIGQMMQDAGINVIPAVRWSVPDTFDFFLDGIEPGGVIAVSTIGVNFDKEVKWIWLYGMEEVLEQLRPELVLHYGQSIGFDFKKTPVKYIQPTAFEGSGGSE